MHRKAYLAYQSKEYFTFFLLNHLKKKVVGQLTIFISNKIATTALKSPFGFFEMDEFKEEFLVLILGKVELFCASLGIEKVLIKNIPEFYNHDAVYSSYKCFKQMGFRAIEELHNYHIPIDEYPFEVKIAATQLGRMQKAIKGGFKAQLDHHSKLKEVYQFIYLCRSERRYSGLVDLKELELLFSLHPKEYFLFVVIDNNEKIVAANISVRVSQDILYTWYTQHLESYNSFSPVILLHKCIYDFCQENRIKFIDLSVAKDGDGSEKITLQKFKRRIGGIKCNRTVFEKKLNE